MKLAGILNEPPFDPLSWSGTARHFFRALDRAGTLAAAFDVQLSRAVDRAYRVLNIAWPMALWKERYHLDPRRFRSLTGIAGRRLRDSGIAADGVLQIGAWYSMPDVTSLPCYSYHDGNLALRVRSGQIGIAASHPRVLQALRWERETYAKLRGIFVMSAWLGDSFVRDFGVPADKVHVVGAGINFETIPPKIARTQSTPRFLMVGKDFARKGGDVLLRAFARVRAQLPQAELVLIGPTLSSPPDGVRCLGYLSKAIPADVALIEETYRSADVYVLPSLYEPFGISLLEAMAYSLPCIAADHCAMPEIVSHNETGIIVKTGDDESLAAAMLALANDPARSIAYGTRGRQKLLERYTWDAVASRIAQAVG